MRQILKTVAAASLFISDPVSVRMTCRASLEVIVAPHRDRDFEKSNTLIAEEEELYTHRPHPGSQSSHTRIYSIKYASGGG